MKEKKDDINVYELYLKDIRKYGTIDDAKTREYLKIYKNGSAKEKKLAKEHIIGAHQRFVLSVANKFAHKDNLMDIISEGNIGLIRAIEEYDINSDVKFTTYAMYWIRKSIISYITLDTPMVTPNNAIKLATYVPKIRQEFWNTNFRQPTTEEVQEILLEKHNLNFSNKEDLAIYQPLSIDEKYNEDEDGQEFMECSAYTSKTATCNTDSFVKAHDAKIVAQQALSTLSDRDAYIIKCIYGINQEPKSMDAVAAEIGISNERVRQIAVNSVEKLGESCKKLANAF